MNTLPQESLDNSPVRAQRNRNLVAGVVVGNFVAIGAAIVGMVELISGNNNTSMAAMGTALAGVAIAEISGVRLDRAEREAL